jgi:hypothetical protein
MLLAQVLGRQRRSEIPIYLLREHLHDLLPRLLAHPPIRLAASKRVYHGSIALLAQTAQ